MDAKKLLGVIVRLIPMCLAVTCAAVEGGKLGPRETSSRVPDRTLYVGASNNCEKRSPCYGSIQDAVDAASSGAVIRVAGGVYTTTEAQVLLVEKAVHLVGGYPLEDLSEPGTAARPVILDAEGVPGRRGVYIDGTGVPTITLAGFQVQRGHARESGGGGIYTAGGSVILQDNSILSSTADVSGGGVFVSAGRVTMRRNIIRGNSARYGGGLYVDGGDLSLERVSLMRNEAGPVGGAVAVGGGAVVGTNVTIVQNALAGAGVYLCGGHLTANHWTLADNGRYGVIADLGIEVDTGSAHLQNSIVASHTTGLGGAGAAAHQTMFHEVSTPCIAGASCVGNLFGDPKFVDPLNGDYHIQRDSAAVDQAHRTDVFVDMDGESRPVGSASDIGADEVGTQPSVYLPLVVRQSTPHRP